MLVIVLFTKRCQHTLAMIQPIEHAKSIRIGCRIKDFENILQ
jgi:hypothetical protein